MNDCEDSDNGNQHAIAIVGMACHLPGALNLKQYWSNLRDGIESVRFYTDTELLAAGESAALLADPNYVRAQPFLENFDRFDAKFWGFSPQDAAVTDPAHRLFLEVAYQSLEHAGHTGYDAEGAVGVFAASGASLYWMENLKSNPKLMDEMGEFLVRHTGNDMNFLATRLSYELDFRGPSLNVQTACSSSLVAVHLAVQSLLGGECDIAIAGGSTVLLPQGRGYLYKAGEILSPDGHCRPFDAKSGGTVFGSGAAAVVLRRLDDALADGDTILAVIAGSAINNDGAQKVGYLAPGVEGQAGVIAEALEIAGVDAAEVSYIESHGTGTQVGDPIEFEALNQVYREATKVRDYCRVGSVKSNIGHLGEAAGAAALIKVVLALQHQQLPPTINFESLNPGIDLSDSPFRINSKLERWDPINGKRQAGVTALGAGGTNAHIVLRQAPETEITWPSTQTKFLLLLSAKTPTALSAAARNLASSLRENSDAALADIAYTLQLGRRGYNFRRALAVSDRDDAIALLEASSSARIVDASPGDRTPSLIFMFPGGGAQYAGMGAELYAREAIYRAAFDACLACLDRGMAEEIRALVLARDDAVEAASLSLERPSRALPALFATEYSLAKQLMAWGAKPTGFIGHSMGEYTAACLAGVLSLSDALRLVVLRGQLFESVPRGGMLSIALSESDARQYLNTHLDIAAVNALDLCVASGPVADIEQLQRSLEAKAIDCTRVRIDVAAHSAMLDDVLQAFRACCQTITFSAPSIPFTSNVSGGWISTAEAIDPNYWVRHLRSTVRFADNVTTVLGAGERVLVEVGPGQTLTHLARAGKLQASATVNAMRHVNDPSSDVERALRTVGHIWASGVDIDWRELWGQESRRRVALPTYPFERKAYWIEPGQANKRVAPQVGKLEKRAKIEDWFSRFCWTQTCAVKPGSHSETCWLIFEDELGLSPLVEAELGEASQIVRVRAGESFVCENERSYQLSSNQQEHFQRLFDALEKADLIPQHIIYLWPVTSATRYPADSLARYAAYEEHMGICFWGLFNLAKVLSERSDSMRLTVVSSDLHAINTVSCPEKATLMGIVAVLPHELSQVKTQSIDVSPSRLRADSLTLITGQILREIRSETAERIVAYRGADRWIRRLESAPLDISGAGKQWLRSGANVLITGGLGGIGLTIATHLATLGAATLVLIGRRGLPDRLRWSDWVAQHGAGDSVALQIKQVQCIEAMGTRVLTIAADVSDIGSMRQAVKLARETCGDINGVIHAAGSMNDQLILLKSVQSAKTVIDAKIKGALILDSLFPATSLDFFVVFSSVAAYLGLPGQVDYTAANAFLDAFACERAQRCTGQSIAINWNAWRDIGMAAELENQQVQGEGRAAEMLRCEHPWFDHYVDTGENRRLFSTQLNVEKHWLLAEHRVKRGAALIPGTGFIELLRAAFEHYCSVGVGARISTANQCLEFLDLQFLEAFQVSDEESKWLHIDVLGGTEGATLAVYSESRDSPHAVVHAQLIEFLAPEVDLAAVRGRCRSPVATRGQFLDQDFMNFGARWGCIENAFSGDGEALLTLRLPRSFLTDIDDIKLHPALLDMAIGGAQYLIDGFHQGQDFYVPVAYQRIVVCAELPSTFLSHVRIRADSAPGFALFDVTLMDSSGKILAEILGFTMKKVDVDFSVLAKNEKPVQLNSENALTSLNGILREAILPSEGVDAFDRVMSRNEHAQWIVSSTDSEYWMTMLDQPESDVRMGGTPSYIKEDRYNPDADEDIPEIEKTFAKNKKLVDCVIRAYPDHEGGRRLVLYYTRQNDVLVTAEELLSYARAELSENQVPQYCCQVEAFVRTTDGMVDRTELSDPLAAQSTYIAPRSKTEKALAKIWQDALGVERIGLGEDFFELGGHSLLLIRVVAKANREFSTNLQVSKLFGNPKVETWAELVDQYEVKTAPVVKKISRVSRSAHRLITD